MEFTTTEIDQLCTESFSIYRSDPEKSLLLALKARDMSTTIRYPKGVATSLHCLASLNRAEGKVDEGLAYGFEAEQIFESIGDQIGVLRCRNSRAGFLKDLGRLEEAIPLFTEVAGRLNELGETKGELSALIGLATCYEVAGDTASYLETSLTTLDKCRAANQKQYEGTSLLAVAGSYADFNQWDRAIQYYEEAIQVLHEFPDLHAMGAAISNLGYVCWRAGDFKRATVEYERALSFALEHHRKDIEIFASSSLGFLLVAYAGKTTALNGSRAKQEKQISRGVELSTRAVTLAREGFHALLVDTLIKLGDVYDELDKKQEALGFYEEAWSLSAGFSLSQADVLGKLSKLTTFLGDQGRANTYLTALAELRQKMIEESKAHLLRSVEIKRETVRVKKEREALVRERDELRRSSEEKEHRLTTLALTLADRHQLLEWLRSELLKHRNNGVNGSELPKEILRAIEQHVEESDGWSAFEFEFSELTGDFSAKLLTRSPEISPTEIRIAALLRLGLGTKQIAALLKCSARTVDWHRSSIRKKLDLDTSENLNVFLRTL